MKVRMLLVAALWLRMLWEAETGQGCSPRSHVQLASFGSGQRAVERRIAAELAVQAKRQRVCRVGLRR